MNVLLLLTLVALNLAAIGVGLYLAHLLRSIIVPVLKTDPDVSMRSILESLEEAARTASQVNLDLDINVAEARQQFSRLVVLLDHLQTGVNLGTAATERMEAEGQQVAERLKESQRTASQFGPESPPGTAGDSAATGPNE